MFFDGFFLLPLFFQWISNYRCYSVLLLMFFGGSQTRFFLYFQILASDVFRSALAEIEFIKLKLQIEFLKPRELCGRNCHILKPKIATSRA